MHLMKSVPRTCTPPACLDTTAFCARRAFCGYVVTPDSQQVLYTVAFG
jgi:hypothetical protein